MIVISGYGRSGSSLLVGILTYLGFDTSFSKENVEKALDHPARAGLEIQRVGPFKKGQVIKKPGYFLHHRDALSKSPDILKDIEVCIIPFRGIAKSYESRKYCSEVLKSDGYGGLHGGKVTEARLAEHIGWDVDACLMNDIPMAFLKYPNYTKDAEYFHQQLKSILEPKNITVEDVQRAFDEIGIKEPRV